jgi:hypothetical protein
MKLMALLYFVLSLFGCDVGSSTFVHRIVVDGADMLYSKAYVESGVARFECLGSASGQCHYTLFPRECETASAATGARAGNCLVEPVERFAVAKGDSRQIPDLPSFRLCVSADEGAPGPDCEMPEPIAAR